jgi:hypothetical protein
MAAPIEMVGGGDSPKVGVTMGLLLQVAGLRVLDATDSPLEDVRVRAANGEMGTANET